jgi:hypothetical protein
MGHAGVAVFPSVARSQSQKRHWQVNETSLSDAFPLRAAERLGRANILGLVKAQNLLESSLDCTDVQFVCSLDNALASAGTTKLSASA